MSFKQKNSPLQQRVATVAFDRLRTQIAAQGFLRHSAFEKTRLAEYAKGKAETTAEHLSRQKKINTVDRAGMPIKTNNRVQPPQPPPPVEIVSPQIAVNNNNSDYNLRNMTQNQQTPVNPNGFTNQGNIQGIYGQSMPGTFNRSINSPFMQMADPNMMPPIPGAMDASVQAEAENVIAQTGIPLQPPAGVQTPTTPIYDINNY